MNLKADVLAFEHRFQEVIGKADVLASERRFQEVIGKADVIDREFLELPKALGMLDGLGEFSKFPHEYDRLSESRLDPELLSGDVAPIWEAMAMTKMDWLEMKERQRRPKSHLLEELFADRVPKSHLLEDLFGGGR